MADSLGTAVLDLRTDDSGLRSGLTRAEADTKSGFSRMLGHAARTAVGIGGYFAAVKIGQMFLDPIRSAGEFQKQLNLLWANAAHGKTTMAEVSKFAIKLGADIHLPAVSASDAAKAMLELGKAGFTVKQAMQAAHGTLLLATAAETDAGTAAKVITQNIHAFGLSAKDTNKIVDNMAGFLRSTGTNFNAFADSLTYVSGPAHGAGQGFKETAAQLAILSQKGYEGSIAGTGLRQVLTRLETPTGKAHDAFAKLGISTLDASGKFIGIRAVIEQLQPKLDKMTQGDKNALWKEAFGQTAMNQARALLTTLPGQYDKMVNSVGRVGQAQLLANAATKGFTGALSAFQNSLQTVSLEIGLKMLPVLTTFVRWLTAELPAATAAGGAAVRAIGSAVGQIAAAIQPHIGQMKTAFNDLMATIQQFAAFLSNNVGNIHQFGVAIGIAAGVFVTLTAAVKTYMAVQAALNILMTANPVGLVIVAIAALVAGFVLLYQRSETVRQVTNQLWADFKAQAQPVLDWISKTGIPGVISAFNALVAAVGVLKAHWDQIWSVFGPTVKAAFEVVKTTVVAELKIISDAIQLFVNVLHGRWGDAWGNLKALVATALGAVVSIVGSILHGLAGTAGALAVLIGKAIVVGVKSAVGGLAGLGGDLIGKIGGALRSAAGWAVGSARQIGFAIADGIISGIGNLASRLAGALVGALGSAIGAARSFAHIHSPSALFAEQLGVPIVDGIVAGAESVKQKLADSIQGTVANAMVHGGQAIKTGTDATKSIFDAWAQNVKARVTSVFDGMKTEVDAKFATMQAGLDVMKAKLTPSEWKLATMQAQAAEAAVNQAVAAANTALAGLKAKQDATWAEMLATQAKNMASLTATYQGTKDTAILAGNTYQKGVATAANDPIATALIAAQQAFDATKQRFDQGLTDQATFVAAANVLDAAKVAASGDANATQLLDQYNTWQAALAQEAAAGTAITDQQAADAAAQQAMRDQNYADWLAAKKAVDDAVFAQTTYGLQLRADVERKKQDEMYAALSTNLKAQHDRVLLHLGNVEHAWDLHYNLLVRQADQNGKAMGDAFVNAVGSIATNGTLQGAMTRIANLVRQYLQLHSPAEKGPLSTLDRWWTKFFPTLMSGADTKQLTTWMDGALSPNLNAGMTGAYASDTTAAKSLTANGAVTLNQTFHQTPANADPVAIGQVTTYAFKNLRT